MAEPALRGTHPAPPPPETETARPLLPPGPVTLGSRRLARLPGLAGFLPEATSLHPLPLPVGQPAAVLGWGLKRHGRRARAWARLRGVPYLALEDGFLRSAGLGVLGARPVSLVLDDRGIYYASGAPSRLEMLLESGAAEAPGLTARAEAGLVRFRAQAASKYNQGGPPSAELARRLGEGFVLLADQTRGDASVALGQASEASFEAMLRAALDDHPGKVVAVKLHPDVLAGRRQGFLEQARGDRVVVVDEPVDPAWAILHASQVMVVTSGLGFEAVLAGKPVRSFGLPFYAGWGLTEDALPCPRRTRSASRTSLFAACFLLYARYVDPWRGTPSSFERALDDVAFLRERAAETARTTVALGFSRWKRDAVAPFLAGAPGLLRWAATADEALAQASAVGARIVVWASRCPADLPGRAAAEGVALERVEDGFLRSVGLGARLVPPLSLALDPGGIYYDPNSGSLLEALLEEGGFDVALLARARVLAEAIRAARVSKYNVGAKLALRLPEGRRRILVPGQVEDDASIRLGTRGVRTNLGLLEAVRAEHPSAFVVWKPHPDVTSGFRAGHVAPEAAARLADAVLSDIAMPDLLDAVDEVHTLTSLTGFEALLRGLSVTCWGQPFYAGWGLTTDREPVLHRTRRASLDELVAAALILYPRYLDPVTGLPCRPELAVERLADPSLWRPGPGLRLRQALARWNKRLRPPRSAPG